LYDFNVKGNGCWTNFDWNTAHFPLDKYVTKLVAALFIVPYILV